MVFVVKRSYLSGFQKRKLSEAKAENAKSLAGSMLKFVVTKKKERLNSDKDVDIVEGKIRNIVNKRKIKCSGSLIIFSWLLEPLFLKIKKCGKKCFI